MATQGTVADTPDTTNVGTQTPEATVSQIMVDGAWTGGSVRLLVQNPQGSGYLPKPIWSKEANDFSDSIGVIRTPDVGVTYKVEAVDIVGTVNIYFGP